MSVPSGHLDLTALPNGGPAAALAASFPFLKPPATDGDLGEFGRYPVRKFLGAGAAGFVFQAFDRELDRPVVLKVLRPELAAVDEHRKRFVREAKAAAAVPSDHVVPIFAVGVEDGLPYLVMPLLAGETLQTRLHREGVLAVNDALEVARQTAVGLADAHAAGLVHRDIKPANLWVEPDAAGRVRRVRLLDFGLARPPLAADSLTALGGVIGTPHYMAPEQAQGEPLDHRTDLFALGVTLYGMLCGKLPFDGTNLTATLVAVATKPHPPILGVNPAVPPAAADLIDRLLAKKPADRPDSAAEVADHLDALLRERGANPRNGGFSTALPFPAARTLPAAPQSPARTPPPAHGTASTADLATILAPRIDPLTLPPQAAPPVPPMSVRRSRPKWLLPAGVVTAVLAVGTVVGLLLPKEAAPPDPSPIKVGVLHSQSGNMKLSEDPVIDATLFAIDEVNAAGGVRGRKLVPVVADGKSDPDVFAVEADRLLGTEKVSVLFGCWTSASRKAVRPVVERHRGLLFYPVQYEGLEQSPAIVYLGHAPNQQLLPAVDFLVREKGAKRVFLVGSDYVYPRSANAIIRDHIDGTHAGTAAVVGERYRPLGDDDWTAVADAVLAAKPDVVLNTVNGSSNSAFLKALRAAEAKAKSPRLPLLSVSVTANELAALPAADVAGDYLAGTHFDLPGVTNTFADQFRRRYGAERHTTDMMAAAYCGVHLWAMAADKAGSVEPAAVRAAVGGLSFDGPGGKVTVDGANFHLHQPVRIAQVKADGTLAVAFKCETGWPIRPEPFPPTRTPREWNQYLTDLQAGYGGKWMARPSK